MLRKKREIREEMRTKRLSVRVGNCLLGEGFKTDADVLAAVRSSRFGLDRAETFFYVIPNMGRVSVAEALAWLWPMGKKNRSKAKSKRRVLSRIRTQPEICSPRVARDKSVFSFLCGADRSSTGSVELSEYARTIGADLGSRFCDFRDPHKTELEFEEVRAILRERLFELRLAPLCNKISGELLVSLEDKLRGECVVVEDRAAS